MDAAMRDRKKGKSVNMEDAVKSNEAIRGMQEHKMSLEELYKKLKTTYDQVSDPNTGNLRRRRRWTDQGTWSECPNRKKRTSLVLRVCPRTHWVLLTLVMVRSCTVLRWLHPQARRQIKSLLRHRAFNCSYLDWNFLFLLDLKVSLTHGSIQELHSSSCHCQAKWT
jgi:hypothetical protein